MQKLVRPSVFGRLADVVDEIDHPGLPSQSMDFTGSGLRDGEPIVMMVECRHAACEVDHLKGKSNTPLTMPLDRPGSVVGKKVQCFTPSKLSAKSPS